MCPCSSSTANDWCMAFPSFCVKQKFVTATYAVTWPQNRCPHVWNKNWIHPFYQASKQPGFTTNSLSPPDHGISPYGVDATFSDLVKVAELKGCSVRIQRRDIWVFPKIIWLVVSTHLKNISQMGNLPQIVVKIKKNWNHHLVVDRPFFWKKAFDIFWSATFVEVTSKPSSSIWSLRCQNV